MLLCLNCAKFIYTLYIRTYIVPSFIKVYIHTYIHTIADIMLTIRRVSVCLRSGQLLVRNPFLLHLVQAVSLCYVCMYVVCMYIGWRSFSEAWLFEEAP